ncbi:MAG TPA: VWA domain-containing protein [Amaricoccus sp.]|uniref:VWA domain-containing protein n=1 Tax=Amaricoccus sp. TaxID=1872485 RepID=UPI002C21A520|nr:VWA domain-containing protein [Amaricoccus sp.]HMR54712.1 VWA domain-containing protein [Amaricoccus sp.]HMU01728.1 VWA domain-containing protein [Amaricoccus sp.]
MLELAFPWALAALPLPLLVLWLAPARRETVRAVRFPFFDAASAGLDKGEGAVVLPRSWLQMAFAWLLWGLVLLTLSRPEWVGPPVERTEAARDVMLAVDISGSMATKDFASPDNPHEARLDGVKSVLDGFIAGRRDDRVGLVVFGSAPYVLVPFTRDTAAARQLLATLAPGMAGQNTVLGDAIGLAIRSFEASKVEARVLILLSDGSDTASRMAPAKAAAIARQNGVVIHTIAVGDAHASDEQNRVDEATLQAITDTTGGTFHRAGDTTGLADIYARIDALGAREGATVSWRPRTPVAAIPAAAAVILVFVGYAVMLLATRRRPWPSAMPAR